MKKYGVAEEVVMGQTQAHTQTKTQTHMVSHLPWTRPANQPPVYWASLNRPSPVNVYEAVRDIPMTPGDDPWPPAPDPTPGSETVATYSGKEESDKNKTREKEADPKWRCWHKILRFQCLITKLNP